MPPTRNRLRAIGGAHRQAGVDTDQQSWRKARRCPRRDGFVGIVEHALEGRRWRDARNGVVERGRHAVDIGPRPLLGGGELLGRRISRCEYRRHRNGASDHRRARGAEIDQGWIAGRIEQDVGRLDVAMEKAGIVDLLETVEQRPQDAVDRRWIQPAVLLDKPFERIAVEHLHDDIGGAVDFEEVVDADDARRAMQGRHDAPLGDEAIPPPGEILCHLGRTRHHGDAVLAHRQRGRQILLDGDFAVELDVSRPVGDAEAALAKHRKHFVAPDLGADRQRHEVDLRIGPCHF